MYDQYVESNYNLRVVRYDEEKLKEEYQSFNKNELEAFFIGRDILKRVNTEKVYDKETNEYRLMTYKDVAILVATKQTMGLYKKINNITEFKASEIETLVNLLGISDVGKIFFNGNVELKST